MNYRIYDRLRRASSPLEVDLIESYAQGRVTRRDFVRRGALLGLSLPFLKAVMGAAPQGNLRPGTTPGTSAAAPALKDGGTVKVTVQKPSGPLDPLAMADLGSYGIVAQSFEHLLKLGPDGTIGPGLAESWEMNADGSEWTFKLRQGVTWQSGAPFTADDVVATMDRLTTGGNAALGGVLKTGGAKAADANTVVFTLEGPNGQFPALVSVFNAQAVITPKDWVAGSTADAKRDGTGPWKMVNYDQNTGATFERNDAWWGGKTRLDKVEWVFNNDSASRVSGLQGGEVDAIVQIDVLGSEGLQADSANFKIISLRTATHRQIWMRNDTGHFTDKRVRQALAMTLDRELMVQQLFSGQGEVANDHPIAPVYQYFDAAAVPQRTRDIEGAKKLLAEAGVSGLKATMFAPELNEIPQLAELVKQNAAEAGIDITLAVESTDTFYNEWCLTYDPICDGGQEFGIVDYGHRPTPDTYLNAAYATGEWNSAHFKNDAFNAAFKEYQGALDLAALTAACGKMQKIANDEVPYAIPYFYNYLSAHSTKVAGIQISALGQMFLDQAGFVA